MASADLFIRAGDTTPILTDSILDQGGSPLTGIITSVTLVLRSLESALPVTLTGTASVAGDSLVQYVWSATDTTTAGPGLFSAEWHCTLSSGDTYTFPNDGYRTISIQPSLTNAPETLVSIPDAKDVLNIPSSDRSHDEKILRFLLGVQAIVENVAGPMIPRQFDEWHLGGNTYIQLRHRPSTALGTSPLLTLMACSEYRGPIEWPLAIIRTPDIGSLYSCMLDAQSGQVVRRAPGGSVMAFAAQGPQSVHVIYEAGQSRIPANVYEGTLEIVRDFYQQTQQAGPSGWGAGSRGNEEAPSTMWGYGLEGRVRSWLGSTRRHPSIA